MISTVISFSTLELRFFDSLIAETKKFSDDIIVVGYDHFFDGTPEYLGIITTLRAKYPELTWLIQPWDSSHDSKYWHNFARWSGAGETKNNLVLFLDADEIPEGDLMHKWLKTDYSDKYDLHTFCCYWYFRSPLYQATSTEMCGLLVDMSKLHKTHFFTRYERWFHLDAQFKHIPIKCFCMYGKLPIIQDRKRHV